MKALIIQHTLATPPGTTLDWLEQHKIDYEIHFFSSGESVSADDYDLFFICGGGMNVDEEDLYPWLKEEKTFIKEILQKKKKIVGLCLGAQLLAEALGGKVFKAPHWEAGWQNVKLSQGHSLRVFEWHGYQFISPPGSTLTAFNEACPHQAFAFEERVIAFQFHPESTPEWIHERASDPDVPPPGQFVQKNSDILLEMQEQTALKKWYFSQLDQFI